jgi:penicillin-binding protein 1A
VAGVWFGFDTPHALAGNASGGRLAAPAWADFYNAGWHERSRGWQPPPGMVSRVIDPQSGELATEWCDETIVEWFEPERAPTNYCHVHDAPEFDENGWFGDRIVEAFKRIFKM